MTVAAPDGLGGITRLGAAPNADPVGVGRNRSTGVVNR